MQHKNATHETSNKQIPCSFCHSILKLVAALVQHIKHHCLLCLDIKAQLILILLSLLVVEIM